MITTIAFEIPDVFLSQPQEIRHKLWRSLDLSIDSAVIEEKMFNSKCREAYIRGQLSEEAYWKEIINDLPINYEGNWKSLCLLFERTVWLDSELVSIVQFLKKKYNICALANGGPELNRQLNYFSLSNLFDHVICSHDIGVAKPEDAIFNTLLSKTGSAPEETLVVDSSYPNLLKAKDLRFQPYLYTTAFAFQKYFIYPNSNRAAFN